MSVLVTGGLGFIGSNVVKELLNKNENVIILDNLSNSLLITYKNLKDITKKNFKFYTKDLLNRESLVQIFKENQIESVINLAEPIFNNPLQYYNDKLNMFSNLLSVMNDFNVKRLIQASSDIYNEEGNVKEIDKTIDILDDKATIQQKSDKIIEDMLSDFYRENNKENWSINILRIFTTVGVDSNGLLGDIKLSKDDIFSKILRFYINKEKVIVSNNYVTYDNTKIRDYVHVSDVANGILKSLDFIRKSTNQINTFNISTGKPSSESSVVKLFETISNSKINPEYIMLAKEKVSYRTGDKTLSNNILKYDNKFSIDVIVRNIIEYSHNYVTLIKENKNLEKQLLKQSDKENNSEKSDSEE